MSNQNPGSENLQNGSLNQNKTSWMNDSRLSGIDPAKLQMLFSMSGQGASKSQNELMPFLMAVAARSRQNGMTFTPEETNLIIIKRRNSQDLKNPHDDASDQIKEA